MDLSKGTYISFCDADDWYDVDYLQKMNDLTEKYSCDVVICGWKYIYNGITVEEDQQIIEGFYDKKMLEEKVFPNYFHPQGSCNRHFSTSRCTKYIKRELLLNNLQLLPNDISLGEDELATFAVMMCADSAYFTRNWCPYNYCRSDSQMTGGYVSEYYKGSIMLSEQLHRISDYYHKNFDLQIDDFLAKDIILRMKKEITNRPKEHFYEIRKSLEEIRNNPKVNHVISKMDYSKSSCKEKLFCWFVKRRFFLLMYLGTRFVDVFRVNKRKTA